ncbi:MAG: hypothetical protein K6C14_06260 [Eubacterium sp.]|nr:hypothetical protein [Eubacterium sp.]
MNSELQVVNDVVYNSSWRNAYWFARMLMNTDQFGAIGKREGLVLTLTTKLESVLESPELSNDEKLTVCRDIIVKDISYAARQGTKTAFSYEDFAVSLNNEIQSLDDILVFIVTVRYIVLPTNDALRRVPSDDAAFCRDTAKSILDSLGKRQVGKAIRAWDTLGVRGCLDAERIEILHEFTKLRHNLDALELKRSEVEDNAILTAFVQEFERRAGQKRKSRAGNSLEDVATFLFNYYGFDSHPKPDHFQTDIEVDKWFKCKDGWSIGISCKRTLRERWKQVSSADSNALSRYKIKQIWHLITYDRDLSDDKITMLGQQRQVFYLLDTSERYKTASQHVGMKDYVRPLSQLIDDIAKEQGKTIRD